MCESENKQEQGRVTIIASMITQTRFTFHSEKAISSDFKHVRVEVLTKTDVTESTTNCELTMTRQF